MGNRCDRVPGTGKKLSLSSVLSICLTTGRCIAYSLSERPVMEIEYDADGAFPEAQTGRCSALLHSDQGWLLQDDEEELSGTFKGAWDDAEYVA